MRAAYARENVFIELENGSTLKGKLHPFLAPFSISSWLQTTAFHARRTTKRLLSLCNPNSVPAVSNSNGTRSLCSTLSGASVTAIKTQIRKDFHILRSQSLDAIVCICHYNKPLFLPYIVECHMWIFSWFTCCVLLYGESASVLH